MERVTIASIGTTHPWNVAGLGLDLQTAHEFGARALTVVAGVSAQDARGLHALEEVSEAMLRAQLEALPMTQIGALRVGALPGACSVRVVAEFVRTHERTPAVVDPVFGATLGGAFLDDAGVRAFREMLASAPSVILTPNLDEAARLLGSIPIDRENVAAAASALRARGPRAVLLTGGHLDGDPLDALADEHGVQLYDEPRLRGPMRGTGCVLAAALACGLARALPLREAVDAARAHVRARIAAAIDFVGLRIAY